MKRYKESDANEKAKYSQTLERAKNKLILETEQTVKRCKAEKSGTETRQTISSLLKKEGIDAQRENEKAALSGRKEALDSQNDYFRNLENNGRSAAVFANTANDTMNSAIDDAIDSALREAGMI